MNPYKPEAPAYKRGDRIAHYRYGAGTVYQDALTLVVYVEFDSEKGVARSVNPRDLQRV